MGDSKEAIYQKGSNRRRRSSAGKGSKNFKRHRFHKRWKDPAVEPHYVNSSDLKTLQYLTSKLLDQLTSLQSKPAGKFADYHSIFYSLFWLAHEQNLVVFKKEEHVVGAVAFTVDTPWYTRYTCLEEVFVLDIDPSFYGFGRVALKFLKKTAKAYGCSLLETGASMTDEPEMLRNLYEKKGKCTFSYPSFVWVLPN